MPFQSEKQRRYLHANHPDIAQRWEQEYAGGGIARLPFYKGSYTTNFLWDKPKPESSIFDYSGSMINTPDNPEIINFPADQSSLINKYGYPYMADAGTFANDAMFSGIGADFPNFLTDAQANQTLDLNDEELTTNINELSDIYNPYKDHGQFFRQQPVDEYVPWHQRGTLKDVFQAGDFPLRDNFAKTKATVSDLVEGGIDKTRAGGKWLKDLALTAGGAIADIPLGLLNLFQGQFQNTPEEDAMVDLYGGNTIRSGPMAGYNTASMYGRGIIDATQRRLDRRAQVKTDKWNQKKKERWDRANQALEKELARQKEAKEKAEREKQAAFQRQLDQAYQQHGGGGASPSGGGGRYDGASSKQEWSRDPTSYSGSFAHGGLAGLWPKR